MSVQQPLRVDRLQELQNVLTNGLNQITRNRRRDKGKVQSNFLNTETEHLDSHQAMDMLSMSFQDSQLQREMLVMLGNDNFVLLKALVLQRNLARVWPPLEECGSVAFGNQLWRCRVDTCQTARVLNLIGGCAGASSHSTTDSCHRFGLLWRAFWT